MDAGIFLGLDYVVDIQPEPVQRVEIPHMEPVGFLVVAHLGTPIVSPKSPSSERALYTFPLECHLSWSTALRLLFIVFGEKPDVRGELDGTNPR